MKTQMWTSSILCLAVLLHLLVMSGWAEAALTQPLQLATLTLMLTAVLLLRKKKRKRKKAARKPPATVHEMLEKAEGGETIQ